MTGRCCMARRSLSVWSSPSPCRPSSGSAGTTTRRGCGAICGRWGCPRRWPSSAPSSAAADDLIAAMGRDKKVRSGELNFVLARGIGDAFIASGIDRSALETVLAREFAA